MKKKMSKAIVIIALLIGFQVIGTVIGYASDHLSNDEAKPVWWWDKDEEPSEEEAPPLRGGPEEDQRQQQPLVLQELQELYPEIAFLHGPTTGNKVALTFDDGPDPRYTPGVLEVLEEYNVPATFFLMGVRAEAQPELARQIVEEGHVIGNHTFWHPNLVTEGEISTLVNEVQKTEDTLAEIVGYRTTMFRPPYGFLYPELVEELGNLNYSVIAWSVDSLDWEPLLTSEQIAQNVLENIHPGAIVLMHDGAEAAGDRTQTIDALREIIPTLQEQGMEFVTVPELLNIPYQRE
ncbi:chitooligosaccharide deacetylase [Salipaludibacillus neizhouensis]|uniref:Chitooligosaccharide deacetylase n=1 Tax=Salipaludibacillus neizhouensis TaxID=885475 RepID=A0A3A9KF48_9BACI|nr:polysaccharide deacetylase family protein [Salipaludibacillus neizhouensis]RKL69192.1 chitooligosaccharide deacetylase [Salipaludibacillus neizhouensis]